MKELTDHERDHKDGCDGRDFHYNGSGFSRVKICACGAEDLVFAPVRVRSREDIQMQRTENIRATAAELHGQRDYTDAEMDYFELVEDILTAINESDDAEDAMLSWMRRHYDVQKDYFNQTVIYMGNGDEETEMGEHVYKGDGHDCVLCGERIGHADHS